MAGPIGLRHPAPPRAERLAAVTLGAVVTGLAIAFALIPGIRERLVIEDGSIEWITALTFLAAAILGTGVLLRDANLPRIYWAIPAFGAFGFLDEMSFGARIFGYPLPVIDGIEVDSFHDIFDLTDRLAGDLGIQRTHIAAFVLLLAAAAAVFVFKRGLLPRITTWFSEQRPIMLAIGTLGFLAVGVVFDLLGTTTTARFLEETSEFTGSGLLFVAAAVMSDETHRSVSHRTLEDALPGGSDSS